MEKVTIIPFWKEFNEEDDTIYKFRYKPDTISKEQPYETEIIIDELNDSLLVGKSCTCDGNKRYKKECKHIRNALSLLKQENIEFRENVN